MSDLSPPPPPSPAEFTALVYREQGAIYGFLYGLVGNSEQARDLTQDTFHDAWRGARRGEPPFVPGGSLQVIHRWLFQAAYHRAISLLRHSRLIRFESLEASEEHDPERFGQPSSFESDIAEREMLHTSLANLAPPDVACLLLRVVEGFSAAEAGEIIGASPDNINKRLSRAKQRLRAAYLAQETLPQQVQPRKDLRP
ncbi:MAG TPA: sigma-70 family RNA polymerase sigma factor [Ktedonobacterales bacterium]|nr:sigma-70 family RNA polymerase sigma factor [Ktedonobacterales bacterium]